MKVMEMTPRLNNEEPKRPEREPQVSAEFLEALKSEILEALEEAQGPVSLEKLSFSGTRKAEMAIKNLEEEGKITIYKTQDNRTMISLSKRRGRKSA